MRYLVIIATIAAFSLLHTSCSPEESPRDQIPMEAAFTDADAVLRNCVATLYNHVGGNTDGQGLQGTCRGVYDLQTLGGDELLIPTRGADWYDGGLWQAMYMHSWSAGHDLPKNAWLYLYKVVALCNNSLEQIDAHRHLLTVDQYEEYKAEVRAFRAIFYWYLMDLFGRVPLVLSTDVSMNQVKQSERSEVYHFIVNELQEVLDLLAFENSVKRSNYYGRVTRPVALFVLAKLMLNAEIYADDNWTDKNHIDGKLGNNDIVLFRLADVLLMRAEAMYRNGENGQPYYDAIRARAGKSPRPISLKNLLDERLMELCFEGWRRPDLIRFRQYESLFEGDLFNDKVDESDGHTTVFPIPADVMALNNNLKQNPGY